jgi:hypothetical protein
MGHVEEVFREVAVVVGLEGKELGAGGGFGVAGVVVIGIGGTERVFTEVAEDGVTTSVVIEEPEGRACAKLGVVDGELWLMGLRGGLVEAWRLVSDGGVLPVLAEVGREGCGEVLVGFVGECCVDGGGADGE